MIGIYEWAGSMSNNIVYNYKIKIIYLKGEKYERVH